MSFQDDLQKWAAQAYYDADSRRVGEHIRRLLRGDDTGPIDPETNKGRPPEYLQAFPPDRQVSEEEALLRGLYGIPLSAQNPGGWPPDLGALYNAPQGAWISDRTDGEAGNVYWSNVDDTITLSWLWGTNDPIAPLNAIKYCWDPAIFGPGVESGKIFNDGRLLVTLPDPYFCVGAAYHPDGWLLVAALDADYLHAGYYSATETNGRVTVAQGASFSLVLGASVSRNGLTQQMLFAPNAGTAIGVYLALPTSGQNGYIEMAMAVTSLVVDCVITEHVDHGPGAFRVEFSESEQGDTDVCVSRDIGSPLEDDVYPGSCVDATAYHCNPDIGDPYYVYHSVRGSSVVYTGSYTEIQSRQLRRSVSGAIVGGATDSKLIALDWAEDGTRIDVRLTASGNSSFIEDAETGHRDIETRDGTTIASPSWALNSEPPCVFWKLERNVSGTASYLIRSESFAEANQSGHALFKVTLEVNGVAVADLLEIDESYSFFVQKPSDLDIGFEQETYKRDSTDSSSVIWTTDPCTGQSPHVDHGMVVPFVGAKYDVVQEDEGVVKNCGAIPFFPVATDWDSGGGGSSTCRNRKKATLAFLDARAGVYVIHERSGRLLDLDYLDVFEIVAPTEPPGELDTQEARLRAEGTTKATVDAPPPDAVYCFNMVLLNGSYPDQSLGGVPEFFTPDVSSGAVIRDGQILVSAVQPLSGIGVGELRVNALYGPDGDPLALFGATGDDQAIRHISVI